MCILSMNEGDTVNADADKEGFDLTRAFADLAINDPKHGPIVQTLRGLESAVSIHHDLVEAKEALEVAGSLDISRNGHSAGELVQLEALFTHALMLYCRAVHSSTHARLKLDVLGRYTAEEKRNHKILVALRDQVVAHFGKGLDLTGGPWNEDHVVLWRHRGRYSYTYPSRRTAHKGKIAGMLMELLDTAIARIIVYGTDKQDRLMALLNPLLDTDDALREMVMAHPFDIIGFFGKQIPPGETIRSATNAERLEP